MIQIDIEYTGNLHCRATHGPSGARIETDAPTDNQGKGEAFSFSCLGAAALGPCMLTILGLVAQRHGVDLSGAYAQVIKEMAAAPLRRIGRLAVVVTLPASVDPKERQKLEAAALACPVHHSLHPDIALDITFQYK